MSGTRATRTFLAMLTFSTFALAIPANAGAPTSVAKFSNGFYYPAEVVSRGSGKVTVRSADGDTATLPESELRPYVTPVKGDVVVGLWSNHVWYRGVVDEARAGEVHILFEDGDAGWLPLEKVVVWAQLQGGASAPTGASGIRPSKGGDELLLEKLPNGFQRATWGMKKADVLALYPEAKEDPAMKGIRYTTHEVVFGQDAEISLLFTKDGRFARAGVYFGQGGGLELNKRLVLDLQLQFGEVKESKKDPETYLVRWESPETRLDLRMVRMKREQIDLYVWYHSLKLRPALEATLKELD